MTVADQPALRYDLALVCVGLIWGVNIPLMKWALSDLHPLAFNALRFPFAIAFLGIIHFRTRKGPGPKLDARAVLTIAALGLLGHFAYQLLFLLGLERTTSGNSALLIATSPIFTALLASFVLRERPSVLGWLGMGASFSGVIVITTARSGFDVSSTTMIGDVMTVAAALTWGAYTVATRSLTKTWTPVGLAFWSMLVALPGIELIGLPHLDADFRSTTTVQHWIAIVFSGVFSIGLAYWLWNIGVRHVGPTRTAVYTYLTPIVALTGGALFLGESLHTGQVAGGVLVLVGLSLVRMGRSRPSFDMIRQPTGPPRHGTE